MYGQAPMYNQQAGYGQPMYHPQQMYVPPPPMYAPPMNNQVLIQKQNIPTIKNMDMTIANNMAQCQYCSTKTKNILRRKAGCVTFGWCICLLMTGVLWWVPFCCDGCKDAEFMCEGCGQKKAEVPANCC